MYPPVIPGSWQYSGNWLGCYCLIAKDQELLPLFPASKDITCPVCEYPEAVHLSRFQHEYPLHYWCPACETVWQWFTARCPDCDGFIWRASEKHPFECPVGMVRCSVCNMEFEEEFIRYFNESPDFRNEIIEEEFNA